MCKSLGGCWDCKELNHAEIDNAHCGIDVSIKAFSTIPSNCPIQKNYIKNIDICNIQLVHIGELEHDTEWSTQYNEEDYVWVCGSLDYFSNYALLIDGEILFHSKNLPEVLEFIQNYKEEN